MADRIAELEAELKKAKEREDVYESARTAMLFMLEDLEKSQYSLVRAKVEWESTFDAITDPLFIHDKEMMLVRANRAYLTASGEEKFKDIIGRPYYEVFPKIARPFRICLRAQELQEDEEEFSCPVTNRIFKVRVYLIKDTEGKYLYSVHILEDITEAKRAEEEIKTEMEVTSHLLMIAEATAHTTNIDKMMEQVTHCVREITGCDILLAYQWDNAEKVFKPSHETGLPHNLISMFRTEPLKEDEVEELFLSGNHAEGSFEAANLISARDVILSGKIVVLNAECGMENAEARGEESEIQNPKFKTECSRIFPWLSDAGISTICIIPLKAGREALGLLTGLFYKPAGINERLRKIMDGISHQVSTAVDQARLYKETVNKSIELSHKIETIQVMHEIDKNILSTLDKQEIIETIVRMIARLIPCDRAGVGLVDREKGGIIYTAGFGVDSLKKGTFEPFKDTSNVEVVETGRPQYIADFGEIKDILPIEKMLFEQGIRSNIRVPLMIKGEVAGILNIGAKRPSAFTPEDLSILSKIAAQIGIALENARLLSDFEELFIGTVKTLSSAIDAKSQWTAGHSERVTKYALQLGRGMGFSEAELKDLELAGLLHDVGKIGTYEAILDKPGKLTHEEFDIVKKHPGKGAEMLEHIKQLKGIIPGVRNHHEFYNGKGYPDGLKGEGISLMARILTVADTYDAMKADRPYRTGRTTEFIIEEFKRCSGTQFDPKIVEVFLRVSDKL